MNTVYKRTCYPVTVNYTKQGKASQVPFQRSQHREQSRRRADRKKRTFHKLCNTKRGGWGLALALPRSLRVVHKGVLQKGSG